jgi:hypothetical protein
MRAAEGAAVPELHPVSREIRGLVCRVARCAEGRVSCATEPCEDTRECALVGGCVVYRFPQPRPQDLTPAAAEGLRDDAPAENGTRPSRFKRRPAGADV